MKPEAGEHGQHSVTPHRKDPAFRVPTVLQAPHALHTDHLPAFRKGHTQCTAWGSLCSVPVAHTGGGVLTEAPLP